LIATNRIDQQNSRYGITQPRQVGDFKFVVQNQQIMDLASNPSTHHLDRLLIGGRVLLQHIVPSPAIWFGLEFSDVIEETIPLFTKPASDPTLTNVAVKNAVPPRKK